MKLCSIFIQIKATVSNHSKVRVDRIKFALYKVIEYHSMSPSRAIKRVMERVVKKVVDGVDKKTEQKFEQSIDVPVTMPTQDAKTSKLIHIKYELKVEIKLGTLYKNMILTAPITVGNVPFFTKEPDPAVRRPSVPQPMPMSHDANARSSVFSNWSLDLYPQISGDRSSVRTSVLYTPTTPIAVMPMPANVMPVMPINHPSYPVLPMSPTSPTIPPASMMSTNSPQDRPLSMNFPPSAPPIDFSNANAASTPLRPQSLFINRPPSYDEVFGFSHQFSQLNMSNTASWSQNASTKS